MQEIYYDSTMQLFNDGWMFFPPRSESEADAGKVPANAKQVELPHAWNGEGWTYEEPAEPEPSGIGWYYKNLPAGDDFNVLKFEGISAECEIYINGKLICRHLGAYKVFEVELSNLDESRENLLAVKVTDKNTLTQLNEEDDRSFNKSPRYVTWPVPMGSSLQSGGIWRNVWLRKKRDATMETPRVSTCFNKLTIIPESAESGTLSFKLFYEDAVVAEKSAEATAETVEIFLNSYHETWPLKPALYRLETSLLDSDGNINQVISQPVTFFDFCVRNSEFYVNGIPYFLRGQNGFPHCNVPHDAEYIKKFVSKIVDQKVEISRFHTEPPSHAWLDECDRQGIMVIFEMALHGSFGCYAYENKEFQKTVINEMVSLVKEYRRHPSIVMWSLGNEMIVSCERDIGLGKPLFNVLDGWINELRELDSRPVIANSGSDAANLEPKSVGDVDDVHQYGGWYVENLRDLRHFGQFTNKNDMLFQPCISTESIAAYTNDDGEFFIKHTDIRQKKMVEMRLGTITDFSSQAQNYQAFMLKEYAEELWRLRHADSSFAGYLPFGQYTWFKKPFDKGPDGIQPKMIWDTYRKVMGTVHIQFECWSRNLFRGGSLEGELHLFHEDVHLPEDAIFKVEISQGNHKLYSGDHKLKYHCRIDFPLTLGEFAKTGGNTIDLKVYCEGKVVAHNDFSFKVYETHPVPEPTQNIFAYDPAGMLVNALEQFGVKVNMIKHIEAILAESPETSRLLVGPYSMDKDTQQAGADVHAWIKRGGRIVVLEQTPGPFADDIFNSGIGFTKVNQPYWSRWGTNLVKHTDRADMVMPGHTVFNGLSEHDLCWWNKDTFLSNAYLSVKTANENDRILSRIGNGLADDELMPVEYDYIEAGYSTIMIEREIGNGSILISSFLIGEKALIDPVANAILKNITGE